MKESRAPAGLPPPRAVRADGRTTGVSSAHLNRPRGTPGRRSNNASRNLRLLTERGWSIATPSATDRRKITYALTAEGKSVWRNALPLWQDAQWQTEQRLGSEVLAAWTLLDRLTERAP